MENCDSTFSGERVYAHSSRGGFGRMPWSYELGASVTWLKSFDETNLRVKFAVYNLTNQQKKLSVNQEYEGAIGSPNELFGYPESFRPRATRSWS